MMQEIAPELVAAWSELRKAAADCTAAFPSLVQGITGHAQRLGLPAVPLVEVDVWGPANPLSWLGEEPAFKNTDLRTLKELHGAILGAERLEPMAREALHIWCTKLMRFAEIYMPELTERASGRWGSVEAARQGLAWLMLVLAEHYNVFRDIRFLNTALKVGDNRLLEMRRMAERIRISSERELGLTQLRAFLLVEEALSALR